jgi:hypothetical protein
VAFEPLDFGAIGFRYFRIRPFGKEPIFLTENKLAFV